MSNDLVAYSRAGDVFHYRWAARRCLSLIHPNPSLRSIVIEGSEENEKEGEYAIDVSEYYKEENDLKIIKYYQLKHTTQQKDSPFVLSDLQSTIEQFAKRFSQHLKEKDVTRFSFHIVTNRPVDSFFKQNIFSLATNQIVNKRFLKTIEKYTGLNSENLSHFCSILEFQDGEGDYNFQKNELKWEMSQLFAGAIDTAQVESIVALVQERVLPHSNGIINREDILKRFHIFSEKVLFPAPPRWENIESIIEREEHNSLITEIQNSSHPVILHAPGGVGKSVFCKKLVESISSSSLAIAYDCFGAGSYRNRSEPRHRHRDGLVQIINELAIKGLCETLVVQENSLESSIMMNFLLRVRQAVKKLKEIDNSAILYILIDAADNAEMAAKEYNNPCFAGELLREEIPAGCKLVLLCRTERIEMLRPSSMICQLELKPFSKEETILNLKRWFPTAGHKDGVEFHRLTSGNPRVQANALTIGVSSVSELLSQLGPTGTTVEDQIEFQLNNAVAKIKDLLSDSYHAQIQAICIGLASLPPHIPIQILAKAAGVSVNAIKSFISDMGRSLWLYDESVQFRDEPTETWFRKTFFAKKEKFEAYINLLEPLAIHYPYVSEVLPHFYLHAEKYEELIQLSLSEDYLPEDNPIDARNVKVYRLQFAFRAGLRAKNYKDAIKIAIRAGEEMAGNQRQLDLFKTNIDLLIALQDKQKVQDIAFKRLLKGEWNGSENIYTASLLSGIEEYKGEARGYLRAAINWLQIYYEDIDDNEDHFHQNQVTSNDFLEIAYSSFNINGVKESIVFIDRLTDKNYAFNIIKDLIKRLVDIGNFKDINSFLEHCEREPYYIVAIVDELLKVGIFPEKKYLKNCFILLSTSKYRIKKLDQFHRNTSLTSSILSFVEACVYHNFDTCVLLRILRHYVPERASSLVHSDYQSTERTIYLRTLAIRSFLTERSVVDVESILPKNLIDKDNKNYKQSNEVKDFKQVIFGLLPWYLLRIKIIGSIEINFLAEVTNAQEESRKAKSGRYKSHDTLPNEIGSVQSEIIILSKNLINSDIKYFYENYIKDNKSLWVPDELAIVRTAFRVSHLAFIKEDLEQKFYTRIKTLADDDPTQKGERFIGLARAVLSSAPEDASIYFEEALAILSKFGDEVALRWEGISSLSKHGCLSNNVSDRLAYRFIRCAEMVGDYGGNDFLDRGKAIAICTRMSSGVGIAAVSRWRDRSIGRFDYQLKALLYELLKSDKISPSTAWAMSRFFSDNQFENLLSLCLSKEKEEKIKNEIFADAVNLLQIGGVELEYYKIIKQLAKDSNINDPALNHILLFVEKTRENNKSKQGVKNIIPNSHKNINDIKWNDVFQDLDLLIGENFEKCLELFRIKRKRTFSNIEDFWVEVFKRLDSKDYFKFIDVVFISTLNRYEISFFFKQLLDAWKDKVSFKKKWPIILKQIGEKYAQELTNKHSFNILIEKLNLNEQDIDILKKGVFEGLASGYEFSNAEMFFGFVSVASSVIDPNDALELTDYALKRCEIHIEKDFGDGEWADWLNTSDSISNQIAGFIWSVLGSPRSNERWNAVHTIRMLGKLNCSDILDDLIKWLEFGKTGAFGYYKFPFYELHAKLYLLIAFAKVSKENEEILRSYMDLFVKINEEEQHILIQKFAAEIVFNMLSNKNESFDKHVRQLDIFKKSNLPMLNLAYNETVNSYWHINNEVNTEHGFHFGLDIGDYWFKYLGEAFGISTKQVEDLAAEVIINEWGLGKLNGYMNDPRHILWDRSYGERETWYSKTDYPRSDDANFYLSYHSMMVVASKLLKEMPLIAKGDWNDGFEYWLDRHLLTCEDGLWLSDFRDPVPLGRPKWMFKDDEDNWRFKISEQYFYDTLISDSLSDDIWINIEGGWEEKKHDKTESIHIRSALVSKGSSSALMNALQTCIDPYDYKLPHYKEGNVEIYSNNFELNGWVKDSYSSKRFDEYDPYADNIDYPPYEIGEEIINKLDLNLNETAKEWYSPFSAKPSMTCKIWSSYRNRLDENPDQSGKCLSASLSFLRHVCATLDCDFIIDVEIKRDVTYKYRQHDDDYEHSRPKQQLFLLSSDGRLRTTEKNYKLG
ncbi:ATP-binding protein [Chryseobacterium sp. 18068]|uniref:ATP-binding protein n=1 Tax=Chryseobacterium sp. 18068 TaxID=2681414 RepID=UPI00135AE2FB|nr:ATP-binding protein [Chryseobacterium sp. 18068]